MKMMVLVSAIGKSFSFIPRLVVHKTELHRIFFPEPLVRNRSFNAASENENDQGRDGQDGAATSNNNDNDDDDDNDEAIIQVHRHSGGLFVSLRGAVPDVTALTETIRQLLYDLPENVRSMPLTLANIAAELPFTLANIAIEFPSTLLTAAAEFPTTIVNVGGETLITIVQVSTDVAREVVDLPHRASHEWKQLIWVLCLLVFAPVLIFGVVFFLPLNSVNDGIDANRSFVYVTMTIYEVFILLPWIETCNFAMPEARIPVKARILTLVISITLTKVFDASLAEGFFGHYVFPIPFSIIVSAMLSSFCMIPVLYVMTPNKAAYSFRRMQYVHLIYWFSLVAVICWAFGIQRLRGRPMWQSAVSFLFAPLRFICKILIAAPITTIHNPNRWILLNLVVDILFTRVQVATFPFIDSYYTLLLLFSTEVFTLAWRYYNGIDRLALWWNAMWMPAQDVDGKRKVTSIFGHSATEITRGCFRASIPHIAQLNLSLRNLSLREKHAKDQKRNTTVARTMTDDTMPSFDESDNSSAVHDPSMLTATTTTTTTTGEGGGVIASIFADTKGDSSAAKPFTDIEAACEIADMEAERGIDLEDGAVNEGLKPVVASSSAAIAPIEACGASLPFSPEESNELREEDWEQRPLYHVIDSTGAVVISIIVRVNQQLSITMIRNLPSSQHLNVSFQISDERWKQSQIYGWAFVASMLLLLAFLGRVFFRRLETLDGKKLTLSRVMAYLFKDHFWFFFLWLVSTGAFVCASMVNHFGADFSFQFKWVACPNHMAWPRCE
jgi:hypothetical protein